MPFNLRNKSLATLKEYSQAEIRFLLKLAADVKAAKYAGTEQQNLSGKNIALIFQKDSTRTRCAFEVAAHDQGAHVTYIGPSGSQIGYKESMKDTARVLGRFFDGIEFRGFKQEDVNALIDYSHVPVWNGLTDAYHPTQILADFLTMKEHSQKSLSDIRFCFLGDGENNMAHSLMIGAAIMGMDCRIACPKPRSPNQALYDECQQLAKKSGGKLTITDNLSEAVNTCDFLYTDVWVSMGEPDKAWEERIKEMLPFQVNAKTMALTQNPQCYFMHCLPAFHNRETVKGEEIFEKFGLDALEVTDEVFESEQSIVFDQAENRMHTIKAILIATLGG